MFKSLHGGAFSGNDSIADIYEKTVNAKIELDPVGKEDSDVDNDGDSDSTDKYLLKRRKAIKKAISKQKKENVTKIPEIKLSGKKEDVKISKSVESANEERHLEEKAVSQKQQKFFGLVRAIQKGKASGSPEAEKAAASMSKKDVKDFASTKHEGLPVKKEELDKKTVIRQHDVRSKDAEQRAKDRAWWRDYKKRQMKKEEVEIQEKTDYQLYHKTFSGAMQHAYDMAKKRGYTVDPDEIDNKVATGPRKPSSGKTNKYILGTDKKQNLHVQVANLDNERYELNMYIESADLDKKTVIRQHDARSKGAEEKAKDRAWWRDYKKRQMKKEEVELQEAFSEKDFDALKKGDTVTIEFKSSISSNNKRTLEVTAKNIVGAAKVQKVTLRDVGKPKGIKYFLYKRDDKVSFAQGDMAVSIVNYTINEEVELDEALPPHLQKHFDKDGDKVEGKWINGKFVPNKVQPKSKFKSIIRDVTPKGYGPTEDVELDEKCWPGYKQVGMKKKGDKVVPNCVKEESNEKLSKVDRILAKRKATGLGEFGTPELTNSYKEVTPGQTVSEGNIVMNDRDPYRIFEQMVHYLLGSSIEDIGDYQAYQVEEDNDAIRLENIKGNFGIINLVDVQNFYNDREMTMEDFKSMLRDFGVKFVNKPNSIVKGDHSWNPYAGAKEVATGVYEEKTNMKMYAQMISDSIERQQNGIFTRNK